MSEQQSQEYRGNGQHKWEGVLMEGGHAVSRLRVPGGWLYKDMMVRSTVFVPMPAVVKHQV
jgi:hypothetical protein